MLGPFQITIQRLASPSQTDNLTANAPREPFPVTFETVFEQLESWPRMFIEPDGSFVWVGEQPSAEGASTAWQLDGHLYDRDNRLLFVELQGSCPREALDKLVEVFGVAPEELCAELRREGTMLGWEKFLERYT